MTTSNKFFEKMFNENDKICNNNFYKTQTFVNYSQEEKQFLKYLSFYTKYKSFIRNYLTNRNVRNTDKKNYLEIYKQTLTYEEYIRYNTICDNMKVSYENNSFIFGTIFISGYLIMTYLSKGVYLSGRITSSIFLLSFLSSYFYYKVQHTIYSKELNDIYLNISQRLNDNPELKLRPNTDYFDEESETEI